MSDLPAPDGHVFDHSPDGTAWWRLSCGSIVRASAHGVYGALDDVGFDRRSLEETRYDALVVLAAVDWAERARSLEERGEEA